MQKIVIAGAGFGGVRVALDLLQILPNEIISLINDTSYHTYVPDIYQLITTSSEDGVCIPLEQIFKDKNIKIVEDVIAEIDLKKNTVRTASGSIDYDYLVICLGSSTNYSGIPGASSYSHPFKTAKDALKIKHDITSLIENTYNPTVVIVGGSYTGIELAGQLPRIGKAQFALIETSGALLPGMPEWSQSLALKKLRGMGVDVLLNHHVTEVSSGMVIAKEGSIKFDYLIWAGGVLGANLNGQIKGVDFTPKNKIATKKDLSLEGFSNVYCIGDLAECLDEKHGCPLNSTAQIAIGQGRVVARNIALNIKKLPAEDYIPSVPIFVVPIGRRYALSDLAGIKVSGLAGWALKRLVALQYLFSILPPLGALNIWRKGVNI